ncbi:MAG: PD-(D/E)XK nuclease family protein [Armatimonadetes bacterium]|nr:PD-(D/E)XK nuclease family protein [Akkermansiaceae bacterium]
MLQRKFLGYSSPFLPNLVAHLLTDPASLANMLIIVPTSQSGRILRESLAASASALLAPTVSTPGSLLYSDAPGIAPPWLEKIAWMEVLESLSESDWNNYTGLFPVVPKSAALSSEWTSSIAAEIVTLRATLQDHFLNLLSASVLLAKTPESRRWQLLARLETLVEKKLADWSYSSRSSVLRKKFALPDSYQHIILAGITEMPPCLAVALTGFPGKVTALIAAPASEQDHFSSLGLPTESWCTRELPSHAEVRIVANPNQQAHAAVEAISNSGSASSEIALGSADNQTGSAIAQALAQSGWPAFHPATKRARPGLIRWLQLWKNWLTKPSSRHLAALFAVPESASLISGDRARKLRLLHQIRDKHPTIDPAAIVKKLSHSANTNNHHLLAAISALMTQREVFLSQKFSKAILSHLTALNLSDEVSVHLASLISDFLDAAEPAFLKIQRSHIFWLKTLLAEIPSPPAQPPIGRVIDVQGWLELLYEPGRNLVICGMNETFVPARGGGEPWLSETIRKALKLNTDADRHARDAYLLQAMLQMRADHGSAHLICGKNGLGGETYLPSRLLLQVSRETLVPAVKNLFREIEPPEVNLIWASDWNWQPPVTELPQRIRVTSLKDYLACPFRFYLKHLVRMSVPEPDRREMNFRDFGSIVHLVLELWGKDPDARQISNSDKLSSSFATILDEVILDQFGNNPPLAIRIQTHRINQRLGWYAREQVITRAAGWEIIDVERTFEIPSNDFVISGKIDRIDRHRETGEIRVIDYKSGKVKDIGQAHRQKQTASSKSLAHLPESCPAYHSGYASNGKPEDFRWIDLQLPLYAWAYGTDGNSAVVTTPIPTYVQLGKTADAIGFKPWQNFSLADLNSAKDSADWITSSIRSQRFWPPAEKIRYDDFSILAKNTSMERAFHSNPYSSNQHVIG